MLVPILTLLLAPVVYSIIRWYRLRQIMPPGPLGLPWLGNKHQIPYFKPWKKFEEWNKQYGPVMSIMLGSTPTIVLGKAQAAWDLLEKRSEIYSSRPRFVVASDILSENRRGLMLSNSNELWKHWRKLLHNGFHIRKVHVYHEIQSMESKVLIYQILTDPDNFDGYLKRFAASVVVAATYGRRVESVDEWVVKENIASMDYLSSVNLPGKFLVESWPWLLYLPRRLQWFRAGPEARKKKDEHFLTYLLDDVRSRTRQGTCPDCLTSQALAEREKKVFEMSDIQLAYAVSSPFGAGIDTTAGGLSVFIVAMLLFPETMKKAQEELDTVIGTDRMPEFHDKDRLPYVCAIMLETLRWRPIAVLGGTAHASSADDSFDGMFIPKGSTVYANMYGIMRDESLFPEPNRFIPERFLVTPISSSKTTASPDTNTTTSSSNPHVASLPQHPRMTLKDFDLPFGFGRRICPGMHLGQNSLFIVIARMLWAFDIKPAKNEKGEEVLPDPENFTNQFNSKPGPFRAQFIPRNSRIPALVEAEWENAKGQMENWQ